MLVTITDFAENRNTDRDTVNAFIRNHPEIKAQTHREGKNVVIDTDTEAYALLDKQYPLSKLIQVIEDTESRQKLIEAQETIIQLQMKLNEQSRHIAEADAIKMLLEDKQVQLEKAQQEIKEAEIEIEKLRQIIEAERAKTWWQKLRRK